MKVPPFELPLATIREELDLIRSPFSIAVMRAKNPFNIGAIIRVAHSFRVKEIFLVGTEPHYERASMGMQKYEHIVECPGEDELLERTAGRPLVGIERDHATTSIWEGDMPDDLVFVFGSENDGIPDTLLARCASVFAIPMYGINHSYPVAISAGMVMCEWARRRDPRGRLAPPYVGPPLL